ncbi:MAG TPA: glycosyltransferase family 4 protein [Candidatus Binatia bacterium]|nr:glycosyltransferase family 4 protein [Candidatus Binatia bacterium]
MAHRGGRLRVLFISNWFPPVVSGSSFYTSSLARSLAARGHEIAVVTLDWGPEYVPPADLGFPVHRLPVTRLPRLRLFYNMRLMGLANTRANRKRLYAIVTKFRPDVIHHVNHIFDTTFLTVKVAREAKVPLVGSITTPIQHQHPLRQWFMSVADRLTVGRFGVERWDGVVCLDRSVYDYVARQYGSATASRSAVIPFAVRVESMAQYERRSQPRSDRPQILFVGHIHPFRNPVNLIRALALVAREIPDVRLVLAGRVDLQEPVAVARELGLTAEQVQFLGARPHEQVVELMQSSHVFASWTTGPYKSLGTAPMEAMLCGTPVICDLPANLFGEGMPEDGESIVLVDSSNPPDVAAALVRLLKDEPHARRIAAGGRHFVLEQLSWDSIAAQIERFYERVLDHKRGMAA